MPPSKSPDPFFGRLRASLSGDNWRLKARPGQLPPAAWMSSEMPVLLEEAGRGYGKTWVGSNATNEAALMGAASYIALIGATAADARDVMVEGPSGILATAPKHGRPEFEPSKRKLTWPNGAVAHLYSADEPERLRGPEHDYAWADECGAWRDVMAWSQMEFGLRRRRPDTGGAPRVLATTTPRANAIIRDLHAREGKDVIIRRGKTIDNVANLAPAVVDQLMRKYGNTRLGRQELDGELLLDTPGALWTRDMIDAQRQDTAPPLRRVIISVDPAVSNNEGSDETGIIVAGVGRQRDNEGNEHGYILADLSGKYSPNEWAELVCRAYEDYKADRVIAEVNNGGELVRHTINTCNPRVAFKAVIASRGKVVRAERVSALYEQKRIHHVGTELIKLEDQMSEFTSDFDRRRMGYSPDRVDALVWGLSELLLNAKAPVHFSDELLRWASIPRERQVRTIYPPGSPHAWMNRI